MMKCLAAVTKLRSRLQMLRQNGDYDCCGFRVESLNVLSV